VLDLEGNALVHETVPIDPFLKTTFNAGLVSTVSPPTGSTVEVIDLATGERTVTELQTPVGERFTPHSVHPDPDGIWAIDFGNVFTRWEDGVLVDRFDLGGTYDGGTRFGDLYGYVWDDDDDIDQASLIDLGSDSADVLFTVQVDGAVEAHPTRDGGLFVIDGPGRLFHFDATGELVAELPTMAGSTGYITLDPASGKIAVATARGVVSIIDPETGATETLPTLEPIGTIAFGRDGQLLAITGLDGTVRLWDVERGTSAGVAWNGSGAVGGSPSWYDAATSSMWVASSGKLLNIPLDPERWIAQACEVVGRDLTQDEWDRFVLGAETRQSACGRTIVEADDEDVAESTEVVDEPDFEIETTMDWESNPLVGTFEVPIGTDELGCSSGSVLENGTNTGFTNQFTCQNGQREGTFTIEWQIVDGMEGPGDVNGPWTVLEATGDFVGLSGEGVWSGRGAGSTGFGSFPGEISFDS